MTNATIIFSQQLKLMEDGILGNTGREITYKDENGDIRTVMEPLPIHTFLAWKELGFVVKKGEHAIAKFPVWKYSNGKVSEQEASEEELPGRLFMKTAHFFSAAQVERRAQA